MCFNTGQIHINDHYNTKHHKTFFRLKLHFTVCIVILSIGIIPSKMPKYKLNNMRSPDDINYFRHSRQQKQIIYTNEREIEKDKNMEGTPWYTEEV
jgi:hypothetical protein